MSFLPGYPWWWISAMTDLLCGKNVIYLPLPNRYITERNLFHLFDRWTAHSVLQGFESLLIQSHELLSWEVYNNLFLRKFQWQKRSSVQRHGARNGGFDSRTQEAVHCFETAPIIITPCAASATLVRHAWFHFHFFLSSFKTPSFGRVSLCLTVTIWLWSTIYVQLYLNACVYIYL